MKAFIWDLDGTLLDSYGVITSSAVDTLKEHGIAADADELLRYMKNRSLSSWLRKASAEYGIPFERLLGRYGEITHGRDDLITLAPGAAETLRGIREAGGTNYVYTHRGDSTFRILERLGILGEFADLVTSRDGFAPKPSGDGVRELIRRHGLDPRETCYIGDRPMDIFCARDAGVTAVLYLPEGGCVEPTGQEDRIVSELTQLRVL
jgi:phosphoglycolate phosphatase-like HAD superfamily hydrolase